MHACLTCPNYLADSCGLRGEEEAPALRVHVVSLGTFWAVGCIVKKLCGMFKHELYGNWLITGSILVCSESGLAGTV